MKYIRKFENVNKMPRVGDYVLCKDVKSSLVDQVYKDANEKIENFIQNNIGQIIKKQEYPYQDPTYLVQYKIDWDTCGFSQNIFQEYLMSLPEGSRYIDHKHVVEFDPDEEELKLKIMVKKYNI